MNVAGECGWWLWVGREVRHANLVGAYVWDLQCQRLEMGTTDFLSLGGRGEI